MPSVTPKITLTTQLEDIESGIERTTAIVGEPLLWEIEGPGEWHLLTSFSTVFGAPLAQWLKRRPADPADRVRSSLEVKFSQP